SVLRKRGVQGEKNLRGRGTADKPSRQGRCEQHKAVASAFPLPLMVCHPLEKTRIKKFRPVS
ncbi:MAG: hypothetical protein LBL93_01930, partial [Ruminococcus sp.]|nr:hypothetical protein [Ruminococcus sp.]